MAKDLMVSVEDRPGAGAAIGEALGRAGVNIEGMCGLSYEGRGIGHLLVEDVAGARSALESAGIKVEGESDVIIEDVSGVDQPGTFGMIARKIADAGVNITFVYLATRSRIVIGAEDLQKARQALS
jgi:hypothetical protein